MKKILFIMSHASTGGLPQVALKKIENLINNYDLMVIEYADITAGLFIVQKNKIKNLLRQDKFITLGRDKNKLFDIITKFNPDYIHLEEIPESFMSVGIISKLYKNDRTYFITETTHDVNFNLDNKRVLPDKFMHVSKYIADKYNRFNIPFEIIEYPIEYKDRPNRDESLKKLGLDPDYKHVLNVGLFTPGKNQRQIFEIAKMMSDKKIQFHFVGNQAGNFQEYWSPLMKNKPDNCKVWGERNDVEKFYESMDLFLFTSTYELNPLVIKEALSYKMPVLMYDLEPYDGCYDNNKNVKFLSNDNDRNVIKIYNELYTPETNYPSRCYITHTTKNYRETTFGLLYSLIEYSEYPVIVFTVNFSIDSVPNPFKDNKNVFFVEYYDESSPNEAEILETEYGKYVNRSYNSTYKILSMKAKVLLRAFDMGIKDGVYLDSDSVCRYNVDDLMNDIKLVENYPLLTRGVYDIMLDGDNRDIERPLMNYLGVKNRSMGYVQSNIVIFTDSCKNFIQEWKETCEDSIILKNFEKWAPYQDETVVNVLLWKHGYTKQLPMYHFNIRNPRFVKEFENFDDSDKSKYSQQMLGFPFYIDGKQIEWSYIPYDKEDVKVFHGIKKLDEMIDIIEYQNRFKNDFCVIQNCNELYKPLSDVTFPVNKAYCNKHGYDVISYTKSISDTIRPHWQRYNIIKRHIKNYKWIFYMDTDMMFMNWNVKLEDLVDDNYNLIIDSVADPYDVNDPINSKYADANYNIIACAMFFRNNKMSIDFLNDVINNKINCTEFSFDNSIFRCVLGSNDEYKKYTKVFPVDSKKLHAVWYTNKPSYIFLDGPKWNDNGNMFKPGDFILHMVAYDLDERISLMKQFLPYIITDI